MPRRLTHILTHCFLALVEDSLHPSAFRNLLSLTSPRGPTLLSLSSSSPPSLTVALRSRWALFFSHFFSHFCSWALFLSLSFSQQSAPLHPPVWLSLIPKRVAVYCAECRLSPSHRDSVPLSHPRCLFPRCLSSPAVFVCQRRRWWISLLQDLQHIRRSRMSLAMICISLEARDESVRLVEGCKGAFHHVNHLWFCLSWCLTADTRRVNRQARPNTL